MRSNGPPLRTIATALIGSGLLLAVSLALRNPAVHDVAAQPAATPGAEAGADGRVRQRQHAPLQRGSDRTAGAPARPSASPLARRSAEFAPPTEATFPNALGIPAGSPAPPPAAFQAGAFPLPLWVGAGGLPTMAQLSLPASIGPAPFAPTTLAPSAHGGQPFSPVPLFPPGGGGATGSGPIFYFPYFPAGGPIVYVPFDLGEPLSPAVVSGPGLRLAVAAVPEPATWILLACGVLPMLVMLKRQQLAIHVSRLSRLTFAARGHGAVEAAPPVRRTASP